MADYHNFISDDGVTQKKDIVGIVTICFCVLVSATLIAFAVLALM